MKVLVTGGAGSIGSEVVRRLVSEGKEVRVMDVNEEAMWALGVELPQVECVLGDVQWQSDVFEAVVRCDAVVHCAAYKHVRFCENAWRAAHRVNVDGTRRVMDGAAGLPRVLVSSDKAVEPVCQMGYTKLEAEQVTTSRGGRVARFGNVIGSRGSLLPAVVRYAALGKPIPLTNWRMTRFMMSPSEAVDLILEALHDESGRDVFVSSEPRSVHIPEFIKVCRDLFAPHLEIVETMPSPGERFHERFETRDGEIIVSNDKRYLMDRAEIEELVVGALKQMGVAA